MGIYKPATNTKTEKLAACVEAGTVCINNLVLVPNSEFTIRIKLVLKDDMSPTVEEFQKHTKTIKRIGVHSHAHTQTHSRR